MHGEPPPIADTAPPRLVGGKVVHDDVSDAFLTAVAEMHTDFCTAHPLGWSRVGPCLKFNMEKARGKYERQREEYEPYRVAYEAARQAYEQSAQRFKAAAAKIDRAVWNRQNDEMHSQWCSRKESRYAKPGSGTRELCDSFEKHMEHERTKEL